MKTGGRGPRRFDRESLVAVVAPHQKFDAFVCSLVTSIVRPLCFDFLATSRQYCKSSTSPFSCSMHTISPFRATACARSPFPATHDEPILSK